MPGHPVQGAHAASAEALSGAQATLASPSIAFPASVPVGGTGMITVNYTVAPTPLPTDAGDAGWPGVVVLRFPVGVEVASPGFEVYPGPAGMGGSAREFAVFYAKKALPPAPASALRTEEIAIRVASQPVPPRNFVDVHVAGIGGGPPAGSSAVLTARGGAVHFAATSSGASGEPASPAGTSSPTEMSLAHRLPASSLDALPAPERLAAHLEGALPRGADMSAWLAEHAAHMPAAYREEVAAAYRASAPAAPAAPQGAAGAAGASAPQPSFPFPTISSYVYGTLSARDIDGVVRGQAGVSACMYDMGDDNRTLTLLDNLADPSDPRGACTSTNGTGFFDMSVLTLDPTDPLSPVDLRIVFGADAPHSRIADARNGTYELHAATVGDLSGPITGLNVTVPDGHEFRRALWILGTIGSAHARIADEFGHDATAADVRWDPASPAGSSYNRTSGAVTISSVHGRGSQHGAEASPASIAHVYAQHVLAGLRGGGNGAGGVGCSPYLRIDLPALQGGCAWRSGWAHFAAAVVQDSPSLRYHHLPIAVDLEAPAYDVGGRHAYGFARGPDVPGNVAGALWDLYDSAGEPGDTVSGAGAAVWSATAGMRHGGDPSILDFWDAWVGNASNPPMRGVLALNGIDAPSGGPPALAVVNASLSVPYGGTAQASVNATAAGPASFELAAAADAAGRIAPPPAFANLTYWYNGNGTTTALVTLAPNASDVGSYLLNVTARTQGGPANYTLILVNVTDNVPPHFAAVPWDIAVEATGRLTPINASALGVLARDEADAAPRLSHYPPGPLPLGGHFVRWTATDASNNSVAADMYLIVRDTTPPAFGGVANLTLAFAPGVPPVAAYAVPSATDLVDGEVSVSCWPRQGTPVPWGTTTVTCDAGDRSGNYAWAAFGINATRGGTLAPPLVVASNSSVAVEYNRTARIEVNATAAGPASFELAAAADATGRIAPPPAFANLTYRYEGNGTTAALVTLAPNASDVGSYLLNVTARMRDGLSGHAMIMVNVTDRTRPYFAAVPWDIAVEATGRLTPINASALGVLARDEADAAPRLSHYPPGPLPLGGHFVRWTATDASNNTATATMYLTIADTTPPAFGGAPNLTLAFAPGVPPVAAYAVPNATDLVDGEVSVSCWPRQGTPVPWGTTTVTCDAGDRSGNYAWAAFGINATRGGTLAPPLVVASNSSVAVEYNRTAHIEVNATGAGPASIELATAGGGDNHTAPAPAFANITEWYNGNGTTTALVTLAPNASDVGSYLLNVTARTRDGLSGYAMIAVNVTDNVPPHFAAVPWDIAVEATGRLTPINASALGVLARDEADPRPVLSHSPAGPLPLGGHYVRWTAMDASNNTATATMYLTIADTTPPAFGGAPNLTLAFAPGVPPVAAYAVPNATDLVDGEVSVSCWPRQGTPVPWGTTTVTCDAGDRSGNYAWAAFGINATRGGTLAPPLVVASNSSVAVEYNRTARVGVNATGAGPASIALAVAADATGRIASPPAFANLTYRYDGNGTTAALVTLAPNASDVGSYLLNVTARMRDGLSGYAMIAVNVTDNVPPHFAAVPWDVVLEAEGPLTPINATALGVLARDEADPNPVLSHNSSGPLPLGGHHVRWTATDASNNSAAADMYLTIADTTPPSFSSAISNATSAFAPGEAPRISYARPNATDIVDGDVPVHCHPPPGSSAPLGPTLVECDASDRSGNSARASFWFNATRAESPLAAPLLALSDSSVVVPYNSTESVLANVTGAGDAATIALSPLDARGRALPVPAFAALEHVRAGGNATAALVVLAPNASDVGVHRINVTAALRGSFVAHAVLTVNVTDGTPPLLRVPAEAVIEAAGNLTRINASALGVGAFDAVDPSPALSASPPGPLPLGARGVLWTATDASGNAASAWMRLTVRDTTPPSFGATPNYTLVFSGGAQPVADYEAPPASDLVDGADVRVRCLPPPGSPVSLGPTHVACVALDASGNAAWARFWLNATAGGE